MAERNWHRIDKATKGIGPLLLRAGPSLTDACYVGYQRDDGRWFFGDTEVHPAFYCEIPSFDAARP